jgi:hypothetical protein
MCNCDNACNNPAEDAELTPVLSVSSQSIENFKFIFVENENFSIFYRFQVFYLIQLFLKKFHNLTRIQDQLIRIVYDCVVFPVSQLELVYDTRII